MSFSLQVPQMALEPSVLSLWTFILSIWSSYRSHLCSIARAFKKSQTPTSPVSESVNAFASKRLCNVKCSAYTDFISTLGQNQCPQLALHSAQSLADGFLLEYDSKSTHLSYATSNVTHFHMTNLYKDALWNTFPGWKNGIYIFTDFFVSYAQCDIM